MVSTFVRGLSRAAALTALAVAVFALMGLLERFGPGISTAVSDLAFAALAALLALIGAAIAAQAVCVRWSR